MDRREFLHRIGTGAALALFGTAGLTACSALPQRRIFQNGLQDPSELTASQSVDDLALEDLLRIIKASPEFRRLRRQFRKEEPISAWYPYQTDDLALASIIFTIDAPLKEPGQFVVFPYAAFLVEHLNREVADAAIGTIDSSLEHVNLEFLKHKQHNAIKKLSEGVSQILKEAKQKGPKIKSQNLQDSDLSPDEAKVYAQCHGWHCGCVQYCGGYYSGDFFCRNCATICTAGCAAAGGNVLACAAACIAGCEAACWVPEYCCEEECTYSRYRCI